MIDIPIGVNVKCTDGVVGKSTHIILDPKTRKVTHFVVNGSTILANHDHLVSVDKVTKADRNGIEIDCTQDDVTRMEPFTTTKTMEYKYVDYSELQSAATNYIDPHPIKTTGYADVDEQHLPTGMQAIAAGATIDASDGNVGKLGELLANGDSGEVTHFTLAEGHMFGHKEVVLPISAIDTVNQETITLNLTKDQVKQLPAVPIRRDMLDHGNIKSVDFVGQIYDSQSKAAEVLEEVKGKQGRGDDQLKLLNAAVLKKDSDGKLTFEETNDLDGRRGGLIGAIGGGLLGALAGPIGIIVGAAAGAGLGAVSADHWIDLGFPDKYLEDLKNELEADSSALLLLVEEANISIVTDVLNQHGDVIMQHTLSDAAVEQLKSDKSNKKD